MTNYNKNLITFSLMVEKIVLSEKEWKVNNGETTFNLPIALGDPSGLRRHSALVNYIIDNRENFPKGTQFFFKKDEEYILKYTLWDEQQNYVYSEIE